MIVRRVLLVLAILLLSTPACADHRLAAEATCRLSLPTQDSIAIGTGVAFCYDAHNLYVLTNHHVVDGKLGVTVQSEWWKSGHISEPVSGQVEWAALQKGVRDLAVIRFPLSAFGRHVPPVMPLASSDSELREGQPVFTIGAAQGNWPTAYWGHVIARRGTAVEFIPIPAEGRSGSALFDAEGKVIVGLVAWQTSATQMAKVDRGRAVGLSEIYAALRGVSLAGQAFDPDQLHTVRDINDKNCPFGLCPVPPRGQRQPPGAGNDPWRNLPPEAFAQPEAPVEPTSPPPTAEPPSRPTQPPVQRPVATSPWVDIFEQVAGLGLKLTGIGVPTWGTWLLSRAGYLWWRRRGQQQLNEWADKVRERLGNSPVDSQTTPAIRITPAEPSTPPPSTEVREVIKPIPVPSEPPPQVVRSQREYVAYEKPNGEAAAYRQALKDLVQHYSGSADWARMVEQYKEQILAGQPHSHS